MSLYKKVCSCAAAVFAAAVLLSACRAEIKENTTIQNDQTAGTGTAYNAATTHGINENDATAYSKDETATKAANTASVKNEETLPRSTTVASTATPAATTAVQPHYNEWTYRSIPNIYYPTGTQVTYTENPDNIYIIKVSEQRSLPVNRLSTTYNSKGATVFLFSSPVKSKATLTDCVIIFSNKMTIEENIRKDGATGSNKALADILYDNAMKNKP